MTASSLAASVRKASRDRRIPGVVVDVLDKRCSVKLSGSSRVWPNLPFDQQVYYGEPVEISFSGITPTVVKIIPGYKSENTTNSGRYIPQKSSPASSSAAPETFDMESDHSELSGILGNGEYHLSLPERDDVILNMTYDHSLFVTSDSYQSGNVPLFSGQSSIEDSGYSIDEIISASQNCPSGTSFPDSPVLGQWFIHAPTGRQYLYMYNGSAWVGVMSLSDASIYVDFALGADTQDKGFGTGSNAYATLGYAYGQIPASYKGTVTIYLSAGTYSEATTYITNRIPASEFSTITIKGTLSDITSFIATGGVLGSAATQSTVVCAGAGWVANAYRGKLLYCVSGANQGVSLVIKSNTSDTLVLVSNSSFSPQPGDSYVIRDWATRFDSNSKQVLNLSGVRNQIFFEDIYFKGSSSNYSVGVSFSGYPAYFMRCYFSSYTLGAILVSELGQASLYFSFVDVTASTTGILSQTRSNALIYNSFVLGSGSGTGLLANVASTISFQRGSVVEGLSTGVSLVDGSTSILQLGVVNGYQRIENCSVAVSVSGLSRFPYSANLQLSGNATNYVENAGGFGSIDGSGVFTRTAGIFSDGSTDIVQMRAQAIQGQVAYIQTWENWLASALSCVEADGSHGLPAGSPASASAHPMGDADTGLYFPAANSLALSAGAKRVLAIAQDLLTLGQDATSTNASPTSLEINASKGLGSGAGGEVVFNSFAGLASAESAVTFDAAPTPSAKASAASHTHAHTTGVGANRILFVQVSYRSNVRYSTGVTYAGVAMTLLSRTSVSTVVTNEVWYLLAPASGANNVVVTPDTAAGCKIASITYAGISQVTPFDTPVIASGTGLTATAAAVLGGANRLTVDFLHKDRSAEAAAPDGSQTQRYSLSNTTGADLSVYASEKAAGTLMTWTWPTTSRSWVLVSVPLIPSGMQLNQVKNRLAAFKPDGLYFGGINDYVKIDLSGRVSLAGTATVWKDLPPASISVGPGSSSPSFTAYNGNLRAYEFTGSGPVKELNMVFQMHHEYKEGSTIYPHVHLYVPNDVTGGGLKFGLEYTWANKDGIEGATTTITKTVTISANAGNNGNYIIPFDGIVGTGMKISSLFSCRLFRDPSDVDDTFGSSVWLKSSDIHVECDTIGSNDEYIK